MIPLSCFCRKGFMNLLDCARCAIKSRVPTKSTKQPFVRSMKKTSLLILVAATLSTHAALVQFALSPPGTDAAVGLSPSNEVPVVTNSTGSGNTIDGGIVLDTTSNILHIAIGYGSAGGFTDLTGEAIAMHIHGPATPGHNANVLIPLTALNIPATNPALGGTIIGDIVIAPEAVSNLLAGLDYINIHTTLNQGGEVRGQLIQVVTGLPSITCPTNSTAECGTSSTVTAQVSSASGSALTVVWSLNGAAVQTNAVAAGAPGASTSVSYTAVLPLGTNLVTVTATDTANNSASCSFIVQVVDTTPPAINSVTVNPSVLWPPNHQMKSIHVQAQVTDACGPATWKILSVTSNESPDAKGSGHTATDWKISGDHSLSLRAERSGQGTGRIYTITIQATDASGNTAKKTVTVTVPHDQSKKSNTPPAKPSKNAANHVEKP